MSLLSSATRLINKYGCDTTVRGSSVGKAYWKPLNAEQMRQFSNEEDWGKEGYQVDFLAGTDVKGGDTIVRDDGLIAVARAPFRKRAAGVELFVRCIAIVMPGN